MIALKNVVSSEFVERVHAFFSANGPLSKAKNFEFRPQQQEMAARVAQALEEERHLVVEAGTGVGKSLAYLVPAILFALEQHKKAIISTHTINLQEQLLYKDIPILKKILPVEFDAALFKGRQNYLCGRRLARALQQANELFTTTEQADLAQLAEWARRTTDGSLQERSFHRYARRDRRYPCRLARRGSRSFFRRNRRTSGLSERPRVPRPRSRFRRRYDHRAPNESRIAHRRSGAQNRR